MDDPVTELVAQWMDKALDDIAAARVLLDARPALLQPSVYHSQQAAEKALKAFLSSTGSRVPRVHDLQVLADEVSEYDSSVALLADDIRLLNPFASAYRYPGMLEVPTIAETKHALSAAARIVEFVAVRLPSGTVG